MSEQSTVRQLLPHYAVMLLLVFLILGVIRGIVGELDFLVELVIIVVIVFAYRPAVKALGYAPPVWQDEKGDA